MSEARDLFLEEMFAPINGRSSVVKVYYCTKCREPFWTAGFSDSMDPNEPCYYCKTKCSQVKTLKKLRELEARP